MKKQKTQLIIILVVLAVMVAAYFALSAHNKKVAEDQLTDDYTILTMDTTTINEVKVTKTTKTEVGTTTDVAVEGASDEAADAAEGASDSATEETSAADSATDATVEEVTDVDATEGASEAVAETASEGTSTETAEAVEGTQTADAADGTSDAEAVEPTYEYTSEVAYDLVLENGAWVLASDKTVELDQDSITYLLSSLASVTSNKEIAGVTDFAQYGLDHPSLTIEVTKNDGTKTTIYIGDYNSVSSLYYARIGDSANVYMINSTLSSSFGVDASSFAKVDATQSTMGTSTGITGVDIDAGAASSAAAAQDASAESSVAEGASDDATENASQDASQAQ